MKTAGADSHFTAQELAEFLGPRKVMVVDGGAFSGRTLQRILLELGVRDGNVQVVRNFEEAQLEIAVRRPHVLIVDFEMGGLRGLELVETHDAQFANRLEIATIVMNASPTQMTVGMITEASVDAILIKPITFATARAALVHALSNKVSPSPYWSTLEKGKTELHNANLEEAMKLFEEAKKFDPAPTLSYYYLGLACQRRKAYAQAGQQFSDGLSIDPTNYRCLTGYFDLRMECSEFVEAYELAQRLHSNYPINARRLHEFVRLSVLVRKYDDIVEYVKVYESIEQPDAGTRRAVVAALLVAAKASADRGDRTLARAVLKKASQISLRAEILRAETFRYFLESGDVEGAAAFYHARPPSVRTLPEVELLFLELHHASENSAEAIQFGTQLIRSERANARVHELVIFHSRKIGRPAPILERLIEEAESRFPNRSWRAESLSKSNDPR